MATASREGVDFDAPAPSGPPESRRALVAGAVQGLQRFKQSWLSIMILKAGISLGQVAALITLLILASTLSSPLYPNEVQSTSSETCPRPYLFQAWMGANILRLTLCWMVSCWICVRHRRQEQREAASTSIRVGDEMGPAPNTSFSTRNDDSSLPPLSHSNSTSTASSGTLHALSLSSDCDCSHSNDITPATVYTATMTTSSSATVEQYMIDVPKEGQEVLRGDYGYSTNPFYASHHHPTMIIEDRLKQLQRARELSERAEAVQHPDAHGAEGPSGPAAWVDKHAATASKLCGTFAFILFILGTILLFYPNPSTNETCYHSAPMLWWGVMTVVGVGLFLMLQVFVIVVVIGIGGNAVLVLLRKIRLLPATTEAVGPRAPPPSPLTVEELEAIPIVCYVPETQSDVFFVLGTNESAVQLYDTSRLPYPALFLKPHQTTCAICQETYSPPSAHRTVMYKAEPLRLLGCGHVYHSDCIDQWLLQGSGNCPFCNQAVRDTTLGEKHLAKVASKSPAFTPMSSPSRGGHH